MLFAYNRSIHGKPADKTTKLNSQIAIQPSAKFTDVKTFIHVFSVFSISPIIFISKLCQSSMPNINEKHFRSNNLAVQDCRKN